MLFLESTAAYTLIYRTAFLKLSYTVENAGPQKNIILYADALY